VYKLTDEIAVIQTLDFFTPVVDDPYDFGAIAAANAMSDVYAMGGKVVMALNICAFPDSLPEQVLGEILRGGAEMVLKAGASLSGGHTVDDPEPKYGLAVMGTVHPDRIFSKDGARVGDLLVLTKALGTGAITTALKNGRADDSHVAGAVASMKQLNAGAAGAMGGVRIHACTDITGFGLFGHSADLAHKSAVRLRIESGKLPFLAGAQTYAKAGLLPAGTEKNQQFYGRQVAITGEVDEHVSRLAYTPETSGGLLVALDAADVDAFARECHRSDTMCAVIGSVEEGSGIELC
jgi:selenide, water dikinase